MEQSAEQKLELKKLAKKKSYDVVRKRIRSVNDQLDSNILSQEDSFMVYSSGGKRMKKSPQGEIAEFDEDEDLLLDNLTVDQLLELVNNSRITIEIEI